MDYEALARELNDDPIGRNYAGMADDTAIADSLDTVIDRLVRRETMTNTEISNTFDGAEYNALDATNKQAVDNVLALEGDINVLPGSLAYNTIMTAFADGTTTRANFIAATERMCCRSEELGFVKQANDRFVIGRDVEIAKDYGTWGTQPPPRDPRNYSQPGTGTSAKATHVLTSAGRVPIADKAA